MSIIFQLFSAEDLRKLDVTELGKLRDEIIDALKYAGVFKEPGNLHLNLREKVGINDSSPKGLRDELWVQETLLKRFYEVSHQLKTPHHNQVENSFNFDKLIGERNKQDTLEAEALILKWAISCELNHIEFYYALLAARKGVENFYEKNPGAKRKLLAPGQKDSEEVRPKDPDSVYSPFNPRHPLYRQYYDVSKPKSEAPSQTPPFRF